MAMEPTNPQSTPPMLTPLPTQAERRLTQIAQGIVGQRVNEQASDLERLALAYAQKSAEYDALCNAVLGAAQIVGTTPPPATLGGPAAGPEQPPAEPTTGSEGS
jgi:hypothetical protein